MKILIAGDFVPRHRVAFLIDNKDFQTVLGEVRPLTEEADFSIVNLEAPVIYGEPTPITKTGPNLFCNENAVEALRWAWFDCVTLANNHFYGQGEQGVEGTLRACEKSNMLYVGAEEYRDIFCHHYYPKNVFIKSLVSFNVSHTVKG